MKKINNTNKKSNNNASVRITRCSKVLATQLGPKLRMLRGCPERDASPLLANITRNSNRKHSRSRSQVDRYTPSSFSESDRESDLDYDSSPVSAESEIND